MLVVSLLTSCISTKDVKDFQPNENLVVNEEGLIPYNTPIYRITKNDILNLNILTTPKGDAAQFYSLPTIPPKVEQVAEYKAE